MDLTKYALGETVCSIAKKLNSELEDLEIGGDGWELVVCISPYCVNVMWAGHCIWTSEDTDASAPWEIQDEIRALFNETVKGLGQYSL